MTTEYLTSMKSPFRAAVLGHPISHSLSPNIHRAVIEEYGLSGSYVALDITESALPEFVAAMDETWVGLSLTMPLKVKILELIRSRDELVELTQSANTVYRTASGQLALTNTDIFGIEKALQSSGVQSVSRVLIIGSGATARSAAVAARNLGATSMYVQARNADKRESISDFMREMSVTVDSGDIDYTMMHDFDLVISTLPHGATHTDGITFGEGIHAALLDVTYNPWPSALAATWPNNKIVSGKEMLLWQASRQVELFYGVKAPMEAMRRSLDSSG